MILRRFADARLRSALARETRKRKNAQGEQRRIGGLLVQARADAATNYALAQRWKSIAQQAQTERDAACALSVELLRDEQSAERARTQETQP